MSPTDPTKSLAERLHLVEERIAAACDRAHRPRSALRLIAVSKHHHADRIREAYALGLRDFGENYAQELRDKARDLSDLPELRWHFIGAVQRNKVRYLAGTATLVHALDTAAAATALSERTLRQTLPRQAVLLAVHLGSEPSKRGVEPEDLDALFEHCEALDGISVQGLMTLPPPAQSGNSEATRGLFRKLAMLRTQLAARFATDEGRKRVSELSMGMSGDLELAVAEGATMLRIGSALFGPRP